MAVDPLSSLAYGSGGAAGGAGLLGTLGPILGVYGALSGALGGFYSAKNKQYELRSSALDLDYEGSIANLNARQAEAMASDYMRAGEQAIAHRTLQGGLARSSVQASQAARGIQAGVGSAAETIASGDVATEIDVLTINTNRVRAANAARMEAVNQRNRAAFARQNARNLRRSAGGIRPWMSAATSLLGSAANLAGAGQSRIPRY